MGLWNFAPIGLILGLYCFFWDNGKDNENFCMTLSTRNFGNNGTIVYYGHAGVFVTTVYLRSPNVGPYLFPRS